MLQLVFLHAMVPAPSSVVRAEGNEGSDAPMLLRIIPAMFAFFVLVAIVIYCMQRSRRRPVISSRPNSRPVSDDVQHSQSLSHFHPYSRPHGNMHTGSRPLDHAYTSGHMFSPTSSPPTPLAQSPAIHMIPPANSPFLRPGPYHGAQAVFLPPPTAFSCYGPPYRPSRNRPPPPAYCYQGETTFRGNTNMRNHNITSTNSPRRNDDNMESTRMVDVSEVLLTFPPKECHNGEHCPICLDDLVSGTVLAALPCMHAAHLECLTRWLHKDQSMSCPVCRVPGQGHETNATSLVSASPLLSPTMRPYLTT